MDLSELSKDELKDVAKELGISISGNIGEDTLREKIQAFYDEQGKTPVNDNATTDNEPKTPPEPPAKKGMVKVKSEFNGVITVGKEKIDFGGPDDEVEVTEEVANMLCELNGYEKC